MRDGHGQGEGREVNQLLDQREKSIADIEVSKQGERPFSRRRGVVSGGCG